MAGIGAIAGILGTLVSAIGTIAAGSAQAKAAEFEAEQLEIKAQEERAASQRESLEKEREKNLVQSRLQAGAAASGAGAGALDPTIADLASDIEGQGTYNQLMERYTGEERARGLRAQAEASRMEGKAAKTGAMFSAFGTIAGGLSSFGKKYGAGMPTVQEPFDPLKAKPSYGFTYG